MLASSLLQRMGLGVEFGAVEGEVTIWCYPTCYASHILITVYLYLFYICIYK